MARTQVPQGSDLDGAHSGKWLFFRCQRLALREYRASQGQAMSPSGARIFYYTRLVLLRQGWLPAVEPDDTPLPEALVAHFLATATRVARHLAADFKRAVRFIKNPDEQVSRFLADHPLRRAPELTWAPEHLAGIQQRLRQAWQARWDAAWRQATPEHRARVLPLLRPDRLLIRPVAQPRASTRKALGALNKQLAQDQPAADRPESAGLFSLTKAYLYDEPLDDWLLRPVLTGTWFMQVCQALADLAAQVPALVRQHAATFGVTAAGADADDEQDEEDEVDPASQAATTGWQEQVAALPAEKRRRILPLPQGTVTANAIFYFAVTAWRDAAGPAGADPILPDARHLEPAQFHALLALAVQATEHLLWDESLPARAEQPQTPARRQALRELLLSPRQQHFIRQMHRRELRWRKEANASPFAPWTAWETPLAAALDAVEARLAASQTPAEITGERLEALLKAPMPGNHLYLYQSAFADWLRAGLSEELSGRLLDGHALLSFCRSLASAVKDWPANTAGAPDTPEQAALAIFWFTKLALEARSDAPEQAELDRRDRAPTQPDAPPQRADGGLVIWLQTSLPPAAAELAAAIAPVVARVMHRSSQEARQRNQPLRLALLKAGEERAWKDMMRRLRERAQDKNLDNIDDAIFEAYGKLQQQMERVVLPADVTMGLLSGSKLSLVILDILVNEEYTLIGSCYQFLGDIISFACHMIRPSPHPATVALERVEQMTIKKEAAPASADPEEEAIRVLLRLIVAAAHDRLAPRSGVQPGRQDALLLVQGLLASNAGRTYLFDFNRQGIPEAREITRLWQASTPQQESQDDPPEPAAGPPVSAQPAVQVALARLLAYEPVRQSPEMRRAVGYLFEVPMRLNAAEPTHYPPLGRLERLTTWILGPARRAEALRALNALGHIGKTQRQIICARMLARTPLRLALRLLEQSGWIRPPWLHEEALAEASRMTALAEAAEVVEAVWPADGQWEEESVLPVLALASSQARSDSSQNFLSGRVNWLAQLATSPAADNWQARALMNEWLGVGFWSNLWLRPPEKSQAMRFYTTLVLVLPAWLLPVVRAASIVALREGLASVPEVFGLDGCLPPQLPAQLDTLAFFRAMQEQLRVLSPDYRRATEDEDEEAEKVSIRRLRVALQVARRRILALLLAIAGVRSEQQRKLLLAAFSLESKRPDRLSRWLEGEAPTANECRLLCQEVRRWQARTAITPEDVPDLLRAASEQVRRAWHDLRSDPALISPATDNSILERGGT